MYRFIIVLAVVVGAVALMAPSASAGSGFGHGFAWVNDADGDGIPNGQDPDWVPPRDGSGYKLRNGFGTTTPRVGPKARSGNPACTSVQIRQRLRDGSCLR